MSQSIDEQKTASSWHKSDRLQKFARATADGKIEGLANYRISLELINYALSHISEDVFKSSAEIFEAEGELHHGYDIYTCSPTDLYEKNKELLHEFIREEGYDNKTYNPLDYIYEGVGFYGYGDIRYNHVMDAFFGSRIKKGVVAEAYGVGCYYMTTQILTYIMKAYAKYSKQALAS